MLSTSKGIALLLSIAISVLILGLLSLLDEATPTLLFIAFSISFSISYVLIHITLEFLIFKEIGQIYQVLEKIQKK
jgi:two-component system phosphate regulon sensor histidine kinase PhoR